MENAILLERAEPNDNAVRTALSQFKTYWNDVRDGTIIPLGDDPFLSDFRTSGAR